MGKVTIMGMGMSPRDLTPQQLRLLQEADLLVGGQRLLDALPHLRAEKLVIKANLKLVLKQIIDAMQDSNLVVLCSGDPLFFGIGHYLCQHLGTKQVSIVPNVSTVATAFSRIHTAWHDARIVSLHGRSDYNPLWLALKNSLKIAVYTDPVNNPAVIAEHLFTNGYRECQIHIMENLGTENERILNVSPEKATQLVCQDPNIMLIIQDHLAPETAWCSSDSAYVHENGLITKSEIRAIVLCKLRLSRGQTVWDLGAGSGSVGIEAAKLVMPGDVYAVEKISQRVHQIHQNRLFHKAHNLQVVKGELPDAIAPLPTPDRIFIGGGGRDLPQIIQCAVKKLRPKGIVVANTVILNNIEQARIAMEESELQSDVTQVQINTGKEMPWGQRLVPQNPIWIICGRKA